MKENEELHGAQTPLYNLKAVVMETGLKPPTIRAWERRYGLPVPDRTGGGHRQYSQRDIDTLKWLQARQAEGMSISHAVEKWWILVERGEDPLAGGKPAAVVSPLAEVSPGGAQIDDLRRAWVAACRSFDGRAGEQILTLAFARFDPEIVVLELLRQGLADIGRGWREGQVTVQQEHFASEQTIRRLEMLIAAAGPPSRAEHLLTCVAPGDYHAIGLLVLAFMLRRRGWDVIHLGANVPVAELAETAGHLQPDMVVLSAQQLVTAANLREAAQALASRGFLTTFGGQAFIDNPELHRFIPGYFLGDTLEQAVGRIPELLHDRPAPPMAMVASEAYRRALALYTERRALIESQVWGAFVATNQATGQLAEMNQVFGDELQTALRLGDIDLLPADKSWLDHLFFSLHLDEELPAAYVAAYHQGARIHLGEPAEPLVGWLGRLAG